MLVDIPILESIKDSQTQHGLKYENYRRYRSYCSRRLHRLRRSLNVHQGVASSAKARHQRGRKLMDISNAMVLEAGEKNEEYAERMILIPLCLAERAWAYAMQLKQEILEHPRRRFHLIRRLEKAAEHAQRFEKLCHDSESPCSDRTKEEATAYAAYITGLYKVERNIWDEAKDNLSKALAIYFRMSLTVKNNEVLEHYRQRIDELRSSIRYCAFNLTEQDSNSTSKVNLPKQLQFHDLAFRHVQQLEAMAAEAAAAAALASKVETVKEVIKDDEDDDEFKETEEGVDEEQEYQEEDEEEEEDSDDEDEDDEEDRRKQTSTVGGGVTALFKGLFGR